MARNQEPMTDEEMEAFEEAMEEQSEELREALAEDLGGDPEDYRVSRGPKTSSSGDEAVPDGGQ